MAATTRGVLVAVTFSLAVIPVAMVFGSAPPNGTAGTVLAVLAGALGAAAALSWALRFPTRNQSIAYAAAASASIAMAALAQSDPLTAILACTAFASISGYIALFHGPLLMTANFVVLLAVSAMPAVALVSSNGVVWTVCAYAVTLIVNVAVPFGIYVIVRALGVDVLRADRDPLTGLYNRRAFYQRTEGLVAASPTDSQLVLAMIDLDRFKLLNDTHGHAEGDVVLAAVGRTLRDHAGRGAIVGRVGGEEFLVVDVAAAPKPGPCGQKLCDAIAKLPYGITASVGTASIHRKRIVDVGEADRVITVVIRAADEAMYVAKRNGGNQVRHHRMPAQLGPGARRWNQVGKRWEYANAGPLPEPDEVRRLVADDPANAQAAATAPLRRASGAAPGSAPVIPRPRVGKHRLA